MAKNQRCHGCTWHGSSDQLESIDTGEGTTIRLCKSCVNRRGRTSRAKNNRHAVRARKYEEERYAASTHRA